MAVNTRDLTSILLLTAGLGSLATDQTFGHEIATLLGANGPKIIALIGVASSVASQLLRVTSNPAPSAGMQVAHIPDGTQVAEVKNVPAGLS